MIKPLNIPKKIPNNNPITIDHPILTPALKTVAVTHPTKAIAEATERSISPLTIINVIVKATIPYSIYIDVESKIYPISAKYGDNRELIQQVIINKIIVLNSGRNNHFFHLYSPFTIFDDNCSVSILMHVHLFSLDVPTYYELIYLLLMLPKLLSHS